MRKCGKSGKPKNLVKTNKNQRFWPLGVLPGGLLELSWGLLGASWAVYWPLWAYIGPCWGHLGRLGELFEASKNLLGPSGSVLELLGLSGTLQERSRDRPGEGPEARRPHGGAGSFF